MLKEGREIETVKEGLLKRLIIFNNYFFQLFNFTYMNAFKFVILFSIFYNFSFSQSFSLFNGTDLSGWNIHGTEKWYVENGDLVCESGPDNEYGYLSTEKFYDDFILTLEFKQDSNGNSGVFFRSTLEGTKISGWQVEVAPPGDNTGGIYESYGRGWLIKPNEKKDKHLKYGEWNSMKIMVKGDNVKTWLNGVKMINLKDKKIGEGKGSIALQIHSGGDLKIRWRNIILEKI